MSGIFIRGCGAVSPAGWGVPALRSALATGLPLATQPVPRPGWIEPLQVGRVPKPLSRPAFLANPRLRRASAITQFAVAAALEALADEAEGLAAPSRRLGIVMCVMSGCVNYSRRFYDETLRDPATASPLVFPETVFNAPSSHLASLLGTTASNYTLVGDPGTFLQGVALAAEWISNETVEACLVIGAEEMDWLTADAYRLFAPEIVLAEGAGAVYLTRQPSTARLREITNPHLFYARSGRVGAALRMRAELPPGEPGDWLIDGQTGVPKLDRPEMKAWNSWPGQRISPALILGEGLMAGAAWQTVSALDGIRQGRCENALVSVVGCNEQAIGARFARQTL
ncbi:MAG: hypothetical protein L0Y58_10385 [Verrucomicrobia subdivision 3 bacterium]|nr:hypothetical protein [Limisphaerales bacterium]